jgi:hypothetical protein
MKSNDAHMKRSKTSPFIADGLPLNRREMITRYELASFGGNQTGNSHQNNGASTLNGTILAVASLL